MYILNDLWYGKIRPYENNFTNHSNSSDLIKAIIEYERELFTLLDEEETKIYNALSSALSEHQSNSECDAFAKGFRLGALMMLDIFDEKV